MKVFIINLPESVERKEYMLTQCKALSLDVEVFNAVAGRKLTPEEVSMHTRTLSEVATPGELGCALSHISIYRNIIENNIPYALILEDDIIINKDLPLILDEVSQSINKKEIILLNQAKQYLNKVVRTIPGYSIHPMAEADLTCSYIITRDAAVAMLDFLYPVWLLADRWPLLREFNVAEINCLIPPVCSLSELAQTTTIPGRQSSESEIQQSKLIWKKIKKTRPLNVKFRSLLWRLYSRKFYKIIKSDI